MHRWMRYSRRCLDAHVLDTHLVLWWLNGDSRLPQAVVERVQMPEAEVFVSQASLWELSLIHI